MPRPAAGTSLHDQFGEILPVRSEVNGADGPLWCALSADTAGAGRADAVPMALNSRPPAERPDRQPDAHHAVTPSSAHSAVIRPGLVPRLVHRLDQRGERPEAAAPTPGDRADRHTVPVRSQALAVVAAGKADVVDGGASTCPPARSRRCGSRRTRRRSARTHVPLARISPSGSAAAAALHSRPSLFSAAQVKTTVPTGRT